MNQTVLAVIIRARDEASAALGKVGGALKSLGHAATAPVRALGDLVGLLGKVGLAGLGIQAVARAAQGLANALGVDFNAALEQSRIGWETMLGSAQAAERMLKDLQQFAARTPFEFPGLEQASRRLLAMGFAAKDIIPLMTDIGNAASALGVGAAGIDRLVLAIGQMQTRTKVAGNEMLQLTELGVPAWNILADAIGKSVAETQDLVSKGEIASDVFINAFREFSQQNWGEMMEKQSKTFLGALSSISDSVQMLTGQAFEPLFERISEIAQRLAEFAQSAEASAWAERVAAAVDMLLDTLDNLGRVWGEIWASVQAVAAEYGPAIADTVIAWAGGLLDWWSENWPKIATVIQTVLGWVQSFWEGHGERVLAIVGDFWGLVQTIFGRALAALGDVIDFALSVVQGDWEGAWEAMQRFLARAWETIVDTLATGAKTVVNIAGMVAQAFGKEDITAGWAAQIDALAASAKGLVANVVGAEEHVAGTGASRIRVYVNSVLRDLGLLKTTADEINEEVAMLKTPRTPAAPDSGPAGGAAAAADKAASAADKAASALDNLKAALDAAGLSLNDYIDHLVQTHPAAQAAAQATEMARLRLVGLNDQLAATRAASEQAQEALRGMQERVSELSSRLSDAKSRLSDLANVRLPGMNALDETLFRMEQQLKTLQLAKLKLPAGASSAELDKQIEALQKQMEILRLEGSLQFDEPMRRLKQAIEGIPQEMTFDQAMQEIAATKAEIAGLEGALSAAQRAVQEQERYIRSLDQAQKDLNAQIQQAQTELATQEERQKAVTRALETAYTWFINDRTKLQEMGAEAVTQARVVDEATRALLDATTLYAQGQANEAVRAINAALEAYRLAQAEMMNGLVANGGNPIPPPAPNLPVAGAYASGGTVPGPLGAPYWALVHGGETITPPGTGGGDVHIHVSGNTLLGSDQEMARQLAALVRRELRATARANGGLEW